MQKIHTIANKLDGRNIIRLKEELRVLRKIYPNKKEEVLNAIALCKVGVEPIRASKLLSWNEFESFIDGVLQELGYKTTRNVVIRRPRRQIDIVAENDRIILSIDCKHFMKSYSERVLKKIAENQIERTFLLRSILSTEKKIVPVIVTVRDDYDMQVSQVLLVSVNRLIDFLSNINGYEDWVVKI